jgi:hypothetical protein
MEGCVLDLGSAERMCFARLPLQKARPFWQMPKPRFGEAALCLTTVATISYKKNGLFGKSNVQ